MTTPDDLPSEEMSLAVALHFADYPRPHHTLQAPADTNGELYRALKVLAAAYRAAAAPAQPVANIRLQDDADYAEAHPPSQPAAPAQLAEPLTDRLRAAVEEIMQHQFTHNRQAMTALQELIDAADAVVLAAQEGK